MAEPKEGYNSGVNRNVTGTVNSSGEFNPSGGAGGFTPSSYDADLTMDGTAQSVALATDATRISVTNRGATTEAIRIAFGTSAANAEANLTIAAAAATTGFYLPAIADAEGSVVLDAPALATHYAIANAVASDTQVVSVTQGI